ncbi:putative hydrolase of the HAD superfamily [Thermocatellispora tengchongensis]|uniref:Putative hydrolase of the HAD superfamily n=1 Tax=Thermocatellispora tengchongensis TaxID=1073253 RepID=A0A840PDF8_9ACTN|nr:HAD family phosphatase [Thermocatellispora tengchongensis]MBB5137648.1 putative hydrolase of the HAD superfamily [Thermocatellispora tengchongensis]
MGSAFDAVLCDFDGVVRHYDTSALSELERSYGIATGTTARVAFAPEVMGPAVLGRITVDEWVVSIAAELEGVLGDGSAERAEELGRAFTRAEVRLDEEVLDLLRAAQARVPVLLVTNATLQLEDDLHALGLTHFFDDVVSSALVGVAKPERRIYEIAAERAGAAPERCLFVDDRDENVEAARALGMTGVVYGGVADLRAALVGV